MNGGRGDDVLAGDDGPNRLEGSDGRDQLIGRGGNDQLDTGSGSNPLKVVDSRYSAPRSVDDSGEELASCGPGKDRMIRGVTARDFLTPDCEQIWDGPFGDRISIALPGRGARLRYQIRCPRYRERVTEPVESPYRPARCSGEIRATRPQDDARILAHGSFPAGKWTNRDVTARLTRLGRRLTRRDRGVQAVLTLSLTAQHADGPSTETVAWTTRLRR